ncbi:diacylglycerol kinase [Pseudacidovorax sp. RU35E]|jgi:diacylglycerol kinase (ATP)|uniref:diacylglycerol kinase n=1 Tax=Pseudacidovorax sp. RU35E TaxID=1907403 RepID=UPI000954F315|nr:diacylglycerol kinase [Pseudacidovorax sp. RU35E]SIQ15984.1 diacylglycerol kinase (ATP) [Pseudacidovorax sp. RU35E]
MSTPDPTLHANPQKARKGLDRLWHATLYSLHGLKAGWDEPAFRMEACLAIVLVPLAFVVGQSWVETALLIAGVALLMIVELLNTAVEAAIDRIGPEWHDLSKRAKDMGSAAVFITSLLTGGIWLAALWQRFLA